MNQNLNLNELLPELKFDKNRSRVKHCPCGLENHTHFVPYVGYEDKGFCHSCGKTFLPELPKVEQLKPHQRKPFLKPQIKPEREIDFIPYSVYQKQLNNEKCLNNKNHFIQWLGNKQRDNFAFDTKTIEILIETYGLANSGKDEYKGWVLFPYIDSEGRVSDIKAMDYNPDTGKRIKELEVRCKFIGKEILNNWKANTVRSFFGEILLKGNNKPVKIFESEATAIYASVFYPDSICIATGGSNGCKWTEKEKCIVLQGRQITLYPDIDAHDSWEKKVEILRGYGLNVQVSQLIKTNALKFAEQNGLDYSELVKQKYDLRDILKYKDYRNFIKPLSTEPEIKPSEQVIENIINPESAEPYKKETINWDQEIADLEQFFKTATLPYGQVKLNSCGTITNVAIFIESHLATLKANNGNKTFQPHLDRLNELKQILVNSLQ